VKQGRIDGKSNALLCEELGISTFKLNRLLNRLHLVRDGHGKLDEKDFNYIKALHDSGMGRNEIADRLKMSKATVQSALIKLGLSRQYQKRDKVKVFTDIYLLKRLGDSISSIVEKLQIDKKSVGVIYNQFKDRVQSHVFLNEDDYKNKCDRILGNHVLLHSEYRGENTYQVDVLLLEKES
jgi:Helix-turn-helix domain of resolvase.